MDENMSPARLFACLLLLLSTATAGAAVNQLLEKLRSDYAALVAAEHDFHSRRERGALQGVEVADYASYVARLHRLVAEDCVALAGSGVRVPAEITCPTSPSVSIAPASVDQAGEQTSAEKTADLEAELFNGMSEFDEMLLREQERIRAATPHAEGGDGGGGGAGGQGGDAAGSADGDGDGAGGEGDEQVADGSRDSPTYGAGAGTGSPRRQGNNGAPPDTPDGSDDDVVARQLREAAEKETDPVLKKKLWEEYRKYKEGTY